MNLGHYFMRLSMVVVVVLLINVLLSCKKESPPADITLRLPQPSPPLVDVVLLLDQSGSMRGPQGTDPQGIRVEAAKYLVASISEKSAEDAPNRVAIVDFGDDVQPKSANLQPVSPTTGYTEVTAKLRVKSMGGTNILAALKSALAGLKAGGTFDQGRKGRIVVFTDGKPEDKRQLNLNQYFNELAIFVKKELSPLACELYVIAVDQRGDIWSACGPHWQAIAGKDNVVRIRSVRELREKFNEVVNDIFSIPNISPDVLTTGRKSFQVRPYLDRLEFHIFPSTPEMKLRILRPNGSTVNPTSDKDTRQRLFKGYQIISVFDPEAGEWQYEILQGKGRIDVYRNEVPVQMQLVLPKPLHPQGKPIQVIAKFARHSGQPIASERNYPLGLSAQIIGPTGPPKNMQFTAPVKGYYYAEPIVPAKMPGLYRIVLRVQAGSALDTSSTYHVTVSPLPYLDLAPPRRVGWPFAAQYISLTGKLMEAGKPTQSEKHFSNHPNLLYLAQICEQPNGGKSPTYWLSSPDGSHFSARLALPMRQRLGIKQPVQGHYVIHVEHAGKTLDGKDATNRDASMLVVNVETSPLTSAVQVIVALVTVYVAIVLLSWLWVLGHLIRAHKMRVQLTITHFRTDETLASVVTANRTWSAVKTKPWRDPNAKRGKRADHFRGRRFIFWGRDREGNVIGYAVVFWGIALPGSLRRGQSRSIGQIRIRA